ncbi:MAG: rhodanese-like domain-containing protein [Pseudomonadota bacterium]
MRITLFSLILLFSTFRAMAADWQVLIEPQTLRSIGSEVTILDIRSPKAFAKGHVEGALNAPYGTWRGPKENPGEVMTDARLTERLQSLGVNRDTPVIVTYQGKNATDFGSAARVYWTLKSAGLSRIAILNGGLNAWTGAGLPLGTEVTDVTRSGQRFSLSDDWRISEQGVHDVVTGRADAQIVDARPLEFLQGKKKHRQAKTAGTIEGAANVTHSTWFKGAGKAKGQIASAKDVLRLAREAGVEDGEDRPIASFCNTGHWAATNWFALSELAGIANVKLYPESMVGWTQAGRETVVQE